MQSERNKLRQKSLSIFLRTTPSRPWCLCIYISVRLHSQYELTWQKVWDSLLHNIKSMNLHCKLLTCTLLQTCEFSLHKETNENANKIQITPTPLNSKPGGLRTNVDLIHPSLPRNQYLLYSTVLETIAFSSYDLLLTSPTHVTPIPYVPRSIIRKFCPFFSLWRFCKNAKLILLQFCTVLES